MKNPTKVNNLVNFLQYSKCISNYTNIDIGDFDDLDTKMQIKSAIYMDDNVKIYFEHNTDNIKKFLDYNKNNNDFNDVIVRGYVVFRKSLKNRKKNITTVPNSKSVYKSMKQKLYIYMLMYIWKNTKSHQILS